MKYLKILTVFSLFVCGASVHAVGVEEDYAARRAAIMETRRFCISLKDPFLNLENAATSLNVSFVQGANGYRLMSAGQQFTDTAFLNACADMLPEESKHLQDRLFVYFFDNGMLESPFR